MMSDKNWTPESLLFDFVQLEINPNRLADADYRYRETFRRAVEWLEMMLGRPATIADLTRENLEALVGYLADRDINQHWRRKMRSRLSSLWKYATQLGIRDDWRRVHTRKAGKLEGDLQATKAKPGSVRWYYENRMDDSMPSQTKQEQARNAMRKFEVWLKLSQIPSDRIVTAQDLDRFEEFLRVDMQRSKQTARNLRLRVSEVYVAMGRHDRTDPKRPAQPRPEPVEGTARHLFVSRYQVERGVTCTPDTHANTHRVLDRIAGFLGHELTVAEMDDLLFGQYATWLIHEQGLEPASVNGHRAVFNMLARFAYECRLTDYFPRNRKLKEVRHCPDAWTLAEVTRIFQAAATYTSGSWRSAIPCPLFWPAFLRVLWYTGLRVRTMLELERRHFDLAAGKLQVPPRLMKNSRGERFVVGADAVEAVARIWEPERVRLFDTGFTTTKQAGYRVQRDFKRILHLAEVPMGLRRSVSKFHKVRRSVATQVAVAGGPAAAARLLGHSSEQVTARYIDPTFLPDRDATQFLPAIEVSQ